MIYTDYVTAMQQMLGANDVNGQAYLNVILPRMIEFAELKIYRQFDFLTTVITNAAVACTPNNRNIAIPANTFIVVEDVNLVTPAGTTNPESGKRTPLDRVSKEFIDTVAGDVSTAGPPTMYALRSDTAMLLGPWPDADYTVEIVGTQRPALFSATNSPDFISTNLPDLLLSASMIFGAGYQKNFGAQADDPKMALSWQAIYEGQVKDVMIEELRKKAMSWNWQPTQPSPIAIPQPS